MGRRNRPRAENIQAVPSRPQTVVHVIFDAVGYAGAGLILVAYLLSATGRWPASGPRSAAVNVAAGAALVVNGLYHGAMPSVLLNSVWALIGASTLLRTWRAKRSAAA